MKQQSGFSVIELLLVVLTAALLVAIILANYRDAVIVERRTIAQQAMITTAGLQERWFIRLYEYAKKIEDVGGESSAGEFYNLKVTQDPCGDSKCFTVIAIATGEQENDKKCLKMSLNHLGVKRATSFTNEDTTKECWSNQA